MEKRDIDKTIFNMNIIRLGKIFSNLSIFFTILVFAGIVTFILIGLTYALLFLVFVTLMIVTIGTFWFMGGKELWNKGGDAGAIINTIGEVFFRAAPYFAVVAVIFSVLAIVLLTLSKDKSSMPRIVFSGIMIVLSIAGMIWHFVGGGA